MTTELTICVIGLAAGFIATALAMESHRHTITPFKTALALVSAATAYGFLVVGSAFLFAGRGWM